MASANPLPLEQPAEPLDFNAEVPGAGVLAKPAEECPSSLGTPQPVSPNELNAWRRGFTPQAEIWNGRLAMLGLSVGLTVLLVARLVATRAS